jgi:peptidyl-prolyl cis-trans isomerase C
MKHLTIALLAGAALMVVGCNQPKTAAQPAGSEIAVVNGDKLTKTELDSLAPEGFEFNKDNLSRILDKWVSNTLMYQEAVRRGIDKEPQVQSHLKRLEHDYLVNELLDRLTSAVKISDGEVMQYFTAHRDEFTYEVKIMRIILPDSLTAVQTLGELQAGADFAKLAKERSQDILLPGGQESKYFSRSVGDPRMGGDPTVEEAIFALAPGQVTPVIPSQEGYQLIKLVDRKKTKPDVTFAEQKDYIQAILQYRKSQAMVDSVLTSLRGTAKVELKPDAYFGTTK